MGFPVGSMVKNLSANAGDTGLIPGSGRYPGEGNGNLLVFLPGKSHGQRSVMGYSPRGHKKLDTTEHAYTMIVQYCVRMKCHGIMCFKIKW